MEVFHTAECALTRLFASRELRQVDPDPGSYMGRGTAIVQCTCNSSSRSTLTTESPTSAQKTG
jgi:hypothetical protein